MEYFKIDRKKTAESSLPLFDGELKKEWLIIRIATSLSEIHLLFETRSLCALDEDLRKSEMNPDEMKVASDEEFKEKYLEFVFGTLEEKVAEAAMYLTMLQKRYGNIIRDTKDTKIEAAWLLITGLEDSDRADDLKAVRDDFSGVIYNILFSFMSGTKIVSVDLYASSTIAKLEALANIMRFDIQTFVDWMIRFNKIDNGYA